MRAILIAVIVSAACVDTNTVQCGDVTCPPSSRCGPNNECVPEDCGDGLVSGSEVCDGATEATCADLGFYQGELTCGPTCGLDVSACNERCGDDTVNGPELCDGIPPAGFTCADFGFDVGPLGCSSACSPSFASCASIGWKNAPGGATNELHGVVALGASSGVAVGFAGTILRATDGVWLPLAWPVSGPPVDLYAVAANTEGVFAVGAGGTILRLDATTETWERMTSGTSATLYAITTVSDTELLAVGAAGTILRYDGTAWSALNSGTSANLFGVWGRTSAQASIAIAVGENNTIVRSVAGGSWSAVPMTTPSTTLRAVHGVAGEVFVVGDNSTFLRASVATTTFEQLDMQLGTAPPVALLAVWGSESEVLVGGAGRLFVWNGEAVTAMESPTDRSIYALSGIGPERVFGVTRGGGVIEYNGTDRRNEKTGASSFHQDVMRAGTITYALTSQSILPHDGVRWGDEVLLDGYDTTTVARSLWVNGSDVYVAVAAGSATGIHRWPGAGDFARFAGTAPANAIWGVTSPSLRIYAVGDKIQTFDGTTWTEDTARPALPTAPSANPSLHGVWGAQDGTWFAVGDNGVVLRKVGTGAWTQIPTTETVRLTSVWGSSSSDVYAVGELGVILHFDGTSWRRMYAGTGENLSAVHGSSRDNVFAVGTNTSVFHYDGVSWSRMTNGGIAPRAVWTTGNETIFVGSAGDAQWLTRVSTGTEQRCEDAWDNDDADGANCADPDCDDALTCRRGGACETGTRIDCTTGTLEGTTFTGVARVNDLPCLGQSTPGPEASHRFAADRDGPVTVTLDDATGLLELAVIPSVRDLAAPGAGACDLSTCMPATATGTSRSVTFTATPGTTYHVFVDGPLYRAAPFTLTVTCSP